MLSAGASAEFNVMKSHASGGQKKKVLSSDENERDPSSPKADSILPRSINTIGRRLSEPMYNKVAPIMHRETRRSVSFGINLDRITLKVKNASISTSSFCLWLLHYANKFHRP